MSTLPPVLSKPRTADKFCFLMPHARWRFPNCRQASNGAIWEYIVSRKWAKHLWQVCAPGLERNFAPIETLNVRRHNLPSQMTPFIGREAQLADCVALLRHLQTRLLTICGFGGMGKTRTALQIAELCYDDFKDGVWWVPLENDTTADQMIRRIIDQLHIHLQPEPSIQEQIWDFFRDRQLLLVLDNTEQIQPEGAATVIYGLLNAAPQVKCLVTTRHSLNLSAERLVELKPMSDEEAETLFLERARSRRADYAISLRTPKSSP